MAQKLDEARAEYAKNLANELSDLAQSLEERRMEYEDYVQEVADKLAETRQTHAEQLASQLSDLQDSLDNQRRAYGEYVDDVNKKLSRVGEDYAESIDDETKQTKAGVDDKKQEYKRDEEDILEKIARLKKEGKTEQDEEIQDLRKTLRRKQEDLSEYIRESGEKLDEFLSDAKTRNAREVSDLKESLKQRTGEWTRFQDDNQKKRNEYINKNAADLAKEEADLVHSLADRTADWVKYLADNAKAVDEAHTKYTEGLAKEEADLITSLDKKAKALDAYVIEVNKKWEKIQAEALAKLALEETDLANSLKNRKVEYDQYVIDVGKKLDEIKGLHKTAWDEIGTMMVGAFEKAGEAVTTFITTYLMKNLLDALTKGTLWDAVVNFGRKIANIFTGGGVGSSGEGPQTIGLPRGTVQGPNEGSGEGDVTGKGGSSGGGGSMSPANWAQIGMQAFDFGYNFGSNMKYGSTQQNTQKTWMELELLIGFLSGTARKDWVAAATNTFITASTLSAMRDDFQTGAYAAPYGVRLDYTKVLEEIRGILDNIRSWVSAFTSSVGQITSSIVSAVTSPSGTSGKPTPPPAAVTADDLVAATSRLDEARVGAGAAASSKAFADELEKLLKGEVTDTGEYLKYLSDLAVQLKESGVLSAEQYGDLTTAIEAMASVGRLGPGAEAIGTLITQLRGVGDGFEDWTRKVEEARQAVEQLTTQLAEPPATSTPGTEPVTGPRGLMGALLDTVAQALAAAKIPKPNLPSAEELARLLSAQEATMANVLKGVDPNNPTGRKDWAEAYAANTGSAYQSWLGSMISRTKDMLAQWASYNAALQAISNLGNMASDMSRIMPGMVNPLSSSVTPGAGTPVNVLVNSFTVQTTIDGRVVGNAVISNLALQGVRI